MKTIIAYIEKTDLINQFENALYKKHKVSSQTLAQGTPLIVQQYAVDYFSKLGEGRIIGMTFDEQAYFLNLISYAHLNGKEFQSTGRDVRSCLNRLYSWIDIPKEFLTQQKKDVKHLVNDISKDRMIETARASWEILSSRRRHRVLEMIMQRYGDIIGLEDIPELQLDDGKKFPDQLGGYDYKNNIIHILDQNAVPSRSFYDELLTLAEPEVQRSYVTAPFYQQFNTIIHEMAHAYQRQMIQKLDNDDPVLKSDYTRHVMASVFKTNFMFYSHGSQGDMAQKSLYYNQPMERHANKIGNHAAFEYRKAVSPVYQTLVRTTKKLANIPFVSSKKKL